MTAFISPRIFNKSSLVGILVPFSNKEVDLSLGLKSALNNGITNTDKTKCDNFSIISIFLLLISSYVWTGFFLKAK